MLTTNFERTVKRWHVAVRRHRPRPAHIDRLHGLSRNSSRRHARSPCRAPTRAVAVDYPIHIHLILFSPTGRCTTTLVCQAFVLGSRRSQRYISVRLIIIPAVI